MTDPHAEPRRRLQVQVAPQCDGAGSAAHTCPGPAAGAARSGKRSSRDLQRQGLDVDAAVQLEKWRQSRRVQVVRQSTGEVVSEHEHARAAARVYGIPVGSVWLHIHNQKVKDGLRIRAAIQSNPPSPMCAGRVQGGNNDLARTTTSQHAISADSSPHGEDCARSNHNSPADSEHGQGVPLTRRTAATSLKHGTSGPQPCPLARCNRRPSAWPLMNGLVAWLFQPRSARRIKGMSSQWANRPAGVGLTTILKWMSRMPWCGNVWCAQILLK